MPGVLLMYGDRARHHLVPVCGWRIVRPASLSVGGAGNSRLAQYPTMSPMGVVKTETHIQLTPSTSGSSRPPGIPLIMIAVLEAVSPPIKAPGVLVRRKKTPSTKKHNMIGETRTLSRPNRSSTVCPLCFNCHKAKANNTRPQASVKYFDAAR